MSQRFIRAFCAVLAFAFFMPSAAWAQSVFAGTVKDSSGAVMPGVTVEAASPALIEKVRSAVTDENGVYRIIDLRPGVYTLTFTLPGFNTVTRDGLELGSNFTATINVELSVGTLQESITVSGASPVVDVQSNVKQQVLSRDVLDAVPTAKTIQGLGQLVVGVTLNSPDVGGSRAMQQTYFAIRGQGGAQTVVLVDGLMTNGLMGDGAVQAYHNEAMTQEAVYQTAGGSAETLTGGVNMNLVPKDGGNEWRGGFKFAKSPASWQGDNLTDNLIGLGVTGVDRIENFYEINVEQGGPILRNKLWFYGAFRKAQYDKPIANTFLTSRAPALPSGVSAVRQQPWNLRAGHLGREDEQSGRPTDVASERAQQDRRVHGSRPAPSRPRHGSAHRPQHGVGDLEHAELLDRIRQVDPDRLVPAPAGERLLLQPRALRQPLSAGHSGRAKQRSVVPQRAQGRHQHTAAVERLERSARQLP